MIEPGGRLPWADSPFLDARRWRVAQGFEPPRKRRKRRPPEYPSFVTRSQLRSAKNALRSARRLLRRVEKLSLTPLDPRTSPSRLVAAYRELDGIERPLLVLQARLLVLLDCLDGPRRLGTRDIHDIAARVLGLPRRSTDNLLLLGEIFQTVRGTRDAYLQGWIGVRHVLIATSYRVPYWGKEFGMDWIARARRVTLRQFERENRFLHRLFTYDPGLVGKVFYPVGEITPVLENRLLRFGWTDETLERELAARGLPDAGPRDPAENPARMARLEILLDMLVLSADRLSDDDEDVRYRKSLSTPGRQHRLTVLAEPEVAAQWEDASACVRSQTGPVPPWAVATILVQHALEVWERHDPDTLPTERHILERDGYLCQVPGCSSRRNLEAHHIVFRSRGGSNHPSNLVCVCHAHHHHHGIHKGRIRLSGKAPYDLVWEMGPRGECEVFRGEKRLTARRGVAGPPQSKAFLSVAERSGPRRSDTRVVCAGPRAA